MSTAQPPLTVLPVIDAQVAFVSADSVPDCTLMPFVAPATGFRVLEGRGAQAEVEGRTVVIGNRRLMDEERVDLAGLEAEAARLQGAGRTVVHVAEAGQGAPLRIVTECVVTRVLQQDGRASFDVDSDHLGGAVRHLADFGIRSLGSAPPTLEELFLRHYGDEPVAAAAR